MAPDKQPSRVIFVGNIPYGESNGRDRLNSSMSNWDPGLTEEQIIHIFSQAGQVLNFRLVYDRETGRPKGFGFAEYQDIDSAASAVRNLNDYEIMGRKLRVDFSNDGGEEDAVPTALGPTQSQPLNGAALPSMPIPPQSGVLPLFQPVSICHRASHARMPSPAHYQPCPPHNSWTSLRR